MGSTGKASLISDKQGKAIQKIANRTRKLKNEQYRILDAEGNAVLTAQGAEHMVKTSVGDKRNNMPGNISIHNHPSGGTFSADDFDDFGYGAKAIVAATPEGDYMLENLKVGTPTQYEGWYDMRDQMIADGAYKEWGILELRREAEKSPSVAKISAEIRKYSDEWLQQRNAGVPDSELTSLITKVNDLQTQYHNALKAEERRLETEPAHEWLKKNASKYGFRYTFKEKRTK